MTLSHSRMWAVIWSARQDLLAWLHCHNRAFVGVPTTVRIDNLKTVLRRGPAHGRCCILAAASAATAWLHLRDGNTACRTLMLAARLRCAVAPTASRFTVAASFWRASRVGPGAGFWSTRRITTVHPTGESSRQLRLVGWRGRSSSRAVGSSPAPLRHQRDRSVTMPGLWMRCHEPREARKRI